MSDMDQHCVSKDGWCEGPGPYVLMFGVAVFIVLPILIGFGYFLWFYYIKKQDREPRRLMERQEQV